MKTKLRSGFSFNSHKIFKINFLEYFYGTHLWSEKQNSSIDLLIEIISEIQIFLLLLKYVLDFYGDTQSDALSYYILSATNILTISNVFEESQGSLLIVLLIISTLALVLLIGLELSSILEYFVTREPKIENKVFKNFLLKVHLKILFLYIFQLNFYIQDNLSQYSNGLILNYFQIWSAVSIINLALSFLIAGLTSMMVHDILKTDLLFSARTSEPNFLDFAFKSLSLIFINLLKSGTVGKWICFIVSWLFIGLREKMLLYSAPFHHKLAVKFKIITTTTALGMLAMFFSMNIALLIKSTLSTTTIIYLIFLSIPISCRIGAIQFYSLIAVLSCLEDNQIMNSNQLFKKLFALEYIFKYGSRCETIPQKSRNTHLEFILYGITQDHKKICDNRGCGCSQLLEREPSQGTISTATKRELIENFKYYLLKNSYLYACKNIPKDSLIKLSFANFLMQSKETGYVSAITVIQGVNNSNQSLEFRSLARRLMGKIEENIKISQSLNETLNIKYLVDYLSKKEYLEGKIVESIDFFKAFWNKFKETNAKVTQLAEISLKFNKCTEKCADIWQQILMKYSKLAFEDHILYGLYLGSIRNSPFSAERTFEKFSAQMKNQVFHQYENENQIIKENLHEPKNVTLIVTLDRERLGKVIYATTNCPIFGYSHKDILDKSVFELFANFNSKKKTHLTNHLEELCGKNTDAFLIHKDGHIIPSLIFAAPLPYFQLGYHYVIIVRPSIDFNEYLFLQSDGRIHFTTKGLRQQLNIDQSQKKLHLAQLTGEFARILKLLRNLSGNNLDQKLKNLGLVDQEDHLEIESDANTVGTLNSVDKNTGLMRLKSISRKEYRKTRTLSRLERITQEPSERASARASERGRRYSVGGQDGEIENFLVYGQIISFQDYEHENETHDYIVKIVHDPSLGVSTFYLKATPCNNQELNANQINDSSSSESDSILKTNCMSENMEFDEITDEANRVKSGEVKGGGIKDFGFDEQRSHRRTLRRSNSNVSPNKFKQAINIAKAEFKRANSMKKVPKDEFVAPQNSNDGSDSDESPTRIQIESRSSMQIAGFTFKRNEIRRSSPKKVTIQPIFPDPSASPQLSSNKKKNTKTFQKLKTLIKSKILEDDRSQVHSDINGFSEQNSQNKLVFEFLKQHNLIAFAQNFDNNAKNSTASYIPGSKFTPQIEEALHRMPQELFFRVMSWLLLIILLLSSLLMIGIWASTSSSANMIESTVELGYAANQRLFYSIEIMRALTISEAIDLGYIQATRYGHSNFGLYSVLQLNNFAEDLQYWNNYVQSRSNVLTSLQNNPTNLQFKMNIRGDSSQITDYTIYDGINEFISSSLWLYSETKNTELLPSSSNIDIQFISENIPNSFSITNEEFLSILTSNPTQQLDNLNNVIIIYLSILSGLFFLFFILLIRYELQISSKRRVFIDALYRVQDELMEGPLFLSNSLKDCILEHIRESRFFSYIQNKSLRLQSAKNNKKGQKNFRLRTANTRGMARHSYINLVLGLFFTLVCILPYIGFHSELSSSRNQILNGQDEVFQAGLLLNEMDLLITGTYQLILTNGTIKWMQTSIDSALENNYEQIVTSISFFAELENNQINIFNILNSNLCSDILQNYNQCYSLGGGVATYGIVGLNSAMVTLFRSLKNNWDNSNQSFSEGVYLLKSQNFADMESIYLNEIIPSYQNSITLLETNFLQALSSFKGTIQTLFIICFLGIILVGSLLIRQLKKSLQIESDVIRAMLRMIPIHIIVENRYLRTFLINNCNGTLDRIKDKF